MPEPSPQFIIAIGASAGGMEEINSFFDHTPLDGVAYVIVQHLSPDFKSRMVELVARHSKLVVKEATDEMPLQCNQVYLIPNDKFMTIDHSRFHLTDKDKVPGPHLTINQFFNSLAADIGKKAIGIILSGLGSDGTEGVMAIKKAGGMVIARNPDTTAFASMPSNAIASGAVDYILEPSLMPNTIEEYVKHEGEITEESKDDEKNTVAIINLLKEQSPLDFTDYKQTTILRRIKRKAAFKNFTRLDQYFDYLKANPEEVQSLSKEFLISVTSFFRDKEAFESLQKEIFPNILKNIAPGEELKMWVAGCATGEEAYAMAILIAEQLTGKLKELVVKIFATDIDTLAVAHAGKGLYNGNIVKDVSQERLENFFTKEGTEYRVKPEIRKMVIFAHHDLVKNPPYCNMHFISCRNLLIYMTPVLQKKIFLMLLFGLKTDGYLILGSSENPAAIIQNLEVINKKWKIYRNLETKRVALFDAFSLPELMDKNSNNVPFEDNLQNGNNTLAEAINVSLSNQMDWLVVCIDKNNQVIKSYGDTTKYLLQKNFANNLEELLPRPLAIAFKTLTSNAANKNEKVNIKGIKINNGTSTISVNLTVSPVNLKKGEKDMLLVTFTTDEQPVIPHTNGSIFDEKIYFDQYTLKIEEEVKELREKLALAYEKLDASNENLQSFNEELLSANEEMQSTNEEMQSVNEELHTVNSDYQLKNKELAELNDDLNNYFRSNINGQLFVNNDLLLMKFSPGTVKQINLLPTDVGRPLSNISTNIKFETIIDDIKQVLKEGSIITKEIESNNGKWYQIMTMPYVQQMDHKNGAIITFNDITQLKKTQYELDEKNQSLLRINADLDNFVHTASHDLLGPLSNIEISIGVMNAVKVTDPELDKFLKIINNSVKKFRALIKEIATIAKTESEMAATEMINIEDLLNEVEWSLAEKMKETKVIISRQLNVKTIQFSKKNLRSILYNLVSNAIKFKGPTKPIIEIKTIKEKDNIILSVQDNGIGILKPDLDKIFDMYGRLNRDVEGQGIGLYLVKKIVNAAGGHIVVESEPGMGSKFVIYLKADNTESTA